MFPYLLTQLQLPMVDMPPACPGEQVRRSTNSILFACLFDAFVCLLVYLFVCVFACLPTRKKNSYHYSMYASCLPQ